MINITNFNTNYDDSNTCCSPVDLLTCGSYHSNNLCSQNETSCTELVEKVSL